MRRSPGAGGSPEFAGSLALIVAIVVVALAVDSNWPKALRVGLAGTIYLITLAIGAGTRRRMGAGPAIPVLWLFVVAGAMAGFVSGVVRSEISLPIVLAQTVTAAFLLGGFHWWTLRAWRRLYERLVSRGARSRE